MKKLKKARGKLRQEEEIIPILCGQNSSLIGEKDINNNPAYRTIIYIDDFKPLM